MLREWRLSRKACLAQKKRYRKNPQEELDFCKLELKMWEVLWWRLHMWLC